MNIIHYCCGSYDNGNYGGVARYDYHVKLIFPNRKFFKGPQQKLTMLEYLEECDNPIIITDNHLSIDIPNKYPCILVHHGCAKTTSQRNPRWQGQIRDLCVNGQNKMLDFRNIDKTIILTISNSCTYDFTKYYGKKYTNFTILKVLHTSELDETIYKKNFNKIPIVLGNWNGFKKGIKIIPLLAKKMNYLKFQQLNVSLKNNNVKEFNRTKQNIYLNSDIFLQLSNSEGNSYASLDAMSNGLLVISTNVGLFFSDVPDNCFVKLDWTKINNLEYMKGKIIYGWNNRYELAQNARKWYLDNCNFSLWERKMKCIINEFYKKQYENI